MYDGVYGARRLAGALDRCRGDKERMAALADALYYCGDQLEQDIEALADFMRDQTKEDV